MDSNRIRGIDLHVHSTASDGTYAPAELLQMAVHIGLQAIAITDHDTVEGSRCALASDIPSGLKFLTGVEISAQPPARFSDSGSLHILGYGIDLNNPDLNRALDELQHARNMRTPKILDKLNNMGIELSMEQVEAETDKGAIGRPHVAKALIKLGVVRDIDEAFVKFLATGKPAYVDKYRLDCRTAFEVIRAAGGVPVLAHPYLIRFNHRDDLALLLKQLRDMGLMGVEAYYSKHTPEFIDKLLDLAREFDLIATGGTDFHGDLSPGVRMGCGHGELYIPYAIYETLISATNRI